MTTQKLNPTNDITQKSATRIICETYEKCLNGTFTTVNDLRICRIILRKRFGGDLVDKTIRDYLDGLFTYDIDD